MLSLLSLLWKVLGELGELCGGGGCGFTTGDTEGRGGFLQRREPRQQKGVVVGVVGVAFVAFVVVESARWAR